MPTPTFLLQWDQVGEKTWETGLDHGVLYIPNASGVYDNGYVWNGLTAVNFNPTGGEASSQYADNIEYARITSKEKCEGTIEAFTYPDEFAQCDGSASLATGVYLGQQTRKPFGMSFRTKIGNDVEDEDHGYKIHLVYGAKANPSSKAYNTMNESPELLNLSWDFTTIPVPVTGHAATAHIEISSLTCPAAKLTALETILYGTPASGSDAAVNPKLPTPDEIYALMTAA